MVNSNRTNKPNVTLLICTSNQFGKLKWSNKAGCSIEDKPCTVTANFTRHIEA